MKVSFPLRARGWASGWRKLVGEVAPACTHCALAGSGWRRMRGRSRGVLLQGERYCQGECLETALSDVLARFSPVFTSAATASRRIPLGLLLVSRQRLTAEQLRAALAAQRAGASLASRKKIGVWMQELGFVTENEVTAALAQQWTCPVLRTGTIAMDASRFPPIPTLLLESFQMFPIDLVSSTATLVVAFSEGIEYTALYAVEQILGYRTEACLVSPTAMKKSLQGLGQNRGSQDIIFDRAEDAEECSQIVGNYSAKVRASEIRMAKCRDYLWVRLRGPKQSLNLVLRICPAAAGSLNRNSSCTLFSDADTVPA